VFYLWSAVLESSRIPVDANRHQVPNSRIHPVLASGMQVWADTCAGDALSERYCGQTSYDLILIATLPVEPNRQHRLQCMQAAVWAANPAYWVHMAASRVPLNHALRLACPAVHRLL
jgi:hypothetical protein